LHWKQQEETINTIVISDILYSDIFIIGQFFGSYFKT